MVCPTVSQQGGPATPSTGAAKQPPPDQAEAMHDHIEQCRAPTDGEYKSALSVGAEIMNLLNEGAIGAGGLAAESPIVARLKADPAARAQLYEQFEKWGENLLLGPLSLGIAWEAHQTGGIASASGPTGPHPTDPKQNQGVAASLERPPEANK